MKHLRVDAPLPHVYARHPAHAQKTLSALLLPPYVLFHCPASFTPGMEHLRVDAPLPHVYGLHPAHVLDELVLCAQAWEDFAVHHNSAVY